ncbi:MAG: hypothetical protein WCX16_03775 [Candidatus Omnitrophota bacterium]
MLNNKQKIKVSVFLGTAVLFLSIISSAFASPSAPSVSAGILLYQEGQYHEAVEELRAVLKEDPENPQALKYLRLSERFLGTAEENLTKQSSPVSTSATSQEQIIDETLNKLEALSDFEQNYLALKKSPASISSSPAIAAEETAKQADLVIPSSLNQSSAPQRAASYESKETAGSTIPRGPLALPQKEGAIETKPSATSIHGDIRMGFGYETSGGGDFIWKRANFNLNEKNFRTISWNQLNRREDTFDPAIYDRLEFNVDVEPLDNPFSFHTNIVIDPWSYVGKTNKISLESVEAGLTGIHDSIDVQLLSLGNTNYTINQIIDTLKKGTLVDLIEYKVRNGHVPQQTLHTKDGWQSFLMPELELHQWFWPVRELWMDYEPNENVKLEIFPFGLEDKAMTTDDPLRLSNNRTWWEESPWLANWKQGHYNPDVTDIWGWPTTPDFTKGKWDDALAFATRDSEARRLTGLRGMSVEFSKDDTEIETTIASPKTLWQDYDSLNALATSVRAKQHLSDQFYVGTLDNAHLGFVNQDLDGYNVVTAYDAGWMPTPSSKISAEYAFSFTEQDLTNSDYDSRQRGSAYDMQLVGTSSYLSGADQDYFGIQPGEDETTFYKTRLRLSRMDKGFQSSLSTYLETRDDEYWSRHLTFRDPANFKNITFDDIDPFRIGNGIDYDRYVINWRSDLSFFDKQIKGLTDIRNVHQASTNKYVETVARTEWGWEPTSRFETKTLLLAHHIPLTTGGFDPFITRLSGGAMANDDMPDGEDASLYTASAGLKYWLTNWLAWDGTWERTNDFTVATDNYPRGIFNDTSVATYTSYGNIYREDYAFLYDQGYFPMPPYEYHNIFRTGITFKPSEKWDLYLDYARNPYEWAGPSDDNLNHVGLAVAYTPTSRLQMYAKYTWSRVNSVNDVLYNNGQINFQSHHNIFLETQYLFKDDSKITGSFGVGPSIYNAYASATPYAGSTTPTMDTQKMFRLFYTKSF